MVIVGKKQLQKAYENNEIILYEFKNYFNSFYGKGGCYEDEDKKFGKDFSLEEITELIGKVLEKHPKHEFAGDSFDRELVCTELLGSNERFLPPML